MPIKKLSFILKISFYKEEPYRTPKRFQQKRKSLSLLIFKTLNIQNKETLKNETEKEEVTN